MCLYISNIPSPIAYIGALHWHLFCKNQYEGENPPPKLNAVRLKIYRSHLVTVGLKQSTENSPKTPSPLDLEWKKANGKYHP